MRSFKSARESLVDVAAALAGAEAAYAGAAWALVRTASIHPAAIGRSKAFLRITRHVCT
jgi:hypothetical protein